MISILSLEWCLKVNDAVWRRMPLTRFHTGITSLVNALASGVWVVCCVVLCVQLVAVRRSAAREMERVLLDHQVSPRSI